MSEIIGELKGYVGDEPVLKTTLLDLVLGNLGNKKIREEAFQRHTKEKRIILRPDPARGASRSSFRRERR
jgi:hypothetical protein